MDTLVVKQFLYFFREIFSRTLALQDAGSYDYYSFTARIFFFISKRENIVFKDQSVNTQYSVYFVSYFQKFKICLD